jgi:hypothetical protein
MHDLVKGFSYLMATTIHNLSHPNFPGDRRYDYINFGSLTGLKVECYGYPNSGSKSLLTVEDTCSYRKASHLWQ